ncbi:hypothetical protein [Acinetobacter sp. YH12116]|uniref:hypothetical protein n=1 Tax=Acinetobacter sp. YH12116 TaxID=2601103 RepID=UPI0015D4128D|nr:hypothetical protein [Acinetobacter sp. YH12116]
MLGIKEIRRTNVLKMLQHLKEDYKIDRKSFAEIVDIPYNLLNQYLSDNAKKTIGSKIAEKLTEPFGLDATWLDHIQNDVSIQRVLSNKFNATQLDATITEEPTSLDPQSYQDDQKSFKILALAKTIYLSRGQDLEINNNVEIHYQVEVPSTMTIPVAFEIKGTGFNKPYKNGYVIICDMALKTTAGEDVILETTDGKVYCGEFLFEKEGFIEIDSVDGQRDSVNKENILRIYPVVAFVTPSQKRTYLKAK